MSDELVDYKVERNCGHIQIIKTRAHQNLSDYNGRLVPELRHAVNNTLCVECEKQKSEQAKQKLAKEMEEKAKIK